MKKQAGFVSVLLTSFSLFFCSFAHAERGWAVSEKDVATAFCKNQSSLSSGEILQYLELKNQSEAGDLSPQNAVIHGVTFENESPWFLDLFSKLTTRLGFYGDPSPRLQVDLQQEFSINPSCNQVFCAVEKIWGIEVGLKLLYLLARYHYNSSDLAYLFSRTLDSNELNDVILGVKDMPLSIFIPGITPKPLYGAGEALESMWGRGAHSNAVIMLFSGWTHLPHLLRQMAIFHELAHTLSHLESPTLDFTPEWLSLGKWTSIESPAIDDSRRRGLSPASKYWKTSLDSSQWVSLYSTTNPSEDFAETVVAYRYAPSRLKGIAPAKYHYIRDRVFKGLEFTSNQACADQ